MSSNTTIVASTPEVLEAFLQNKLEREYYIYCQFDEKLYSPSLSSREAKGIKFLTVDPQF